MSQLQGSLVCVHLRKNIQLIQFYPFKIRFLRPIPTRFLLPPVCFVFVACLGRTWELNTFLNLNKRKQTASETNKVHVFKA